MAKFSVALSDEMRYTMPKIAVSTCNFSVFRCLYHSIKGFLIENSNGFSLSFSGFPGFPERLAAYFSTILIGYSSRLDLAGNSGAQFRVKAI